MNLTNQDPLTQKVQEKGMTTWNALTKYIRKVPYGRTANRTDFSLILSENKGTCSSKHALLKQIADLNKIPNINLIIGLYKMSQENTPKIGTALTDNGLTYMIEAHCYLQIDGIRTDLTSENASFQKIENDIVEEQIIQPNQVGEFKVQYHQDYLKKWIKTENLPFTFTEIWNIREKCIQNLSA